VTVNVKEGVLANEKMQDVRRKEDRLKVSQEVSDIAHVLSTPQGRRVLLALIDTTGALEQCTPIGVESIDAYNVGLGDVGRAIVRKMYEASPRNASLAFFECAEAAQMKQERDDD
jgi:hypothetical protein